MDQKRTMEQENLLREVLKSAWFSDRIVFIIMGQKPQFWPKTPKKFEREQRYMSKTVKVIWKIVTWILVGIVAVFAIGLVGVRIIGIQPYTILSGSMEPEYPVGALIYVQKVDYKTIESGDVITFMVDQDTVATHRVVEVVPDQNDPTVLRYKTKGDANAVEDGSLVHYKNVIGSPIFSIPGLGYFANFVQKPPGLFFAIAGVAVLILIMFIPDLFSKKDKDDDDGKKGSGKKKKKASTKEEQEELEYKCRH